MKELYEDHVIICLQGNELCPADMMYKQLMGKIGTEIKIAGKRIISEVEYNEGSNYIYITAKKV